MRVLIVICVILLVLAVIGWLRFSSDSGDPTIRLDTEKIQTDSSEMMRQSRQAIDSAAREIDASIDAEPVGSE